MIDDRKVDVEIGRYLVWFATDPRPPGPAPAAPSPEHAQRGERLFADPRLSHDGARSCRGCHEGAATGPRALAQRTITTDAGFPRTASSLQDVHRHAVWFWDARATSLEGALREHLVDDRVLGHMERAAVETAAGGILGEDVEFEGVVAALAAHLRTRTTRTRFDAFLDGDAAALTTLEKRGLDAFLRIGCVQCHNHRTLGGAMHHRFATYETLTEDPGVAAVVGFDNVRHHFKVPGLIGVAESPPYFHDGREDSLAAAVELMARAHNGKDLSSGELTALLSFLRMLRPVGR